MFKYLGSMVIENIAKEEAVRHIYDIGIIITL